MGRCLRPHQPLLNSKLYSSARPQGKKRCGPETRIPLLLFFSRRGKSLKRLHSMSRSMQVANEASNHVGWPCYLDYLLGLKSPVCKKAFGLAGSGAGFFFVFCFCFCKEQEPAVDYSTG